MSIKKFIVVAGIASLVAIPALAQDPIADRKAAMKAVGGAAKTAGEMLKGAKPYDAAAALDALTKMNEVASTFATLFPEGSETGGDTTASPKIWEDRAGFEAAVAKFEMDTAAAVAAAPADLDAFKTAFGAVGANCGTCHKAYRVSKN